MRHSRIRSTLLRFDTAAVLVTFLGAFLVSGVPGVHPNPTGHDIQTRTAAVEDAKADCTASLRELVRENNLTRSSAAAILRQARSAADADAALRRLALLEEELEKVETLNKEVQRRCQSLPPLR